MSTHCEPMFVISTLFSTTLIIFSFSSISHIYAKLTDENDENRIFPIEAIL